MNFFENITFIKTRTQSMSETTTCNESLNSSRLDGTSSSLPNLSGDENNAQIQELKDHIEMLISQLSSAREEINNLSIQNMDF